MTALTEPLATEAGTAEALARLDRELQALAATANRALAARDKALREPIVVAGSVEEDLPGDVLNAMRERRRVRVEGEARLVLEDVARKSGFALQEAAALGEHHPRDRYIRELSLKPENLATALQLQGLSTPEVVTHLREMAARGAVGQAAAAVQELGRRSDVKPEMAREAADIQARLEFPQRERLVVAAENIRERAARLRIQVRPAVDGDKAAVKTLYIARHHLPVAPWPADGQPLEVRPAPAPIW